MTGDAELTAMTAVAAALDKVKEDDVRGRVLQWVNSRYGAAETKATVLRKGRDNDGDESDYPDVAALFTAARPATDTDRALVVGYWYQVHEKKQNLDAQSVNTALKHLGHPISNITSAFSGLIERKPSFAMQVQKKGKTKQARKQYRLTTAGMEAVREMLSGQMKEESGS